MNLLFTLFLLSAASTPQLQPMDSPSNGNSLGPNLVEHDGRVWLSWIEAIDPRKSKRRYRLRYAELVQERWKKAQTIWERDNIFANWADFPSVTPSRRGDFISHWAEKSGDATYAYDVRLAVSKPPNPWVHLGAAHKDKTQTEHGFVSILPNKDGFRAFWLDGRAMAIKNKDGSTGAMSLRSAVIQNQKIKNEEVLDSRVCECCGTDAATTRSGPFIVYRNRSTTEIRDIAIVRRVKNAWTKPKIVHADHWKMPGCPVNGPAADAKGKNAVVAWFTGVDGGQVKVSFSDNDAESFNDAIVVDAKPSVPLGRVDVVLAKNNTAIISWVAMRPDDSAGIFVRRVDQNGRLSETKTIASISASRKSGFPQMVLRGKKLVFAWTEVADKKTSIKTAQLPLSALDGDKKLRRPRSKSPSRGDIKKLLASTLSGEAASFTSLLGKPVLVNLWATWCGPCRAEIPDLRRIHQRFSKQGLVVLGINVDDADANALVTDFIKDHAIPYSVWRDPKEQFSRWFGVTTLPATFLIDRKGQVVWERKGIISSDKSEIQNAIQKLLAGR